MTAPPARGRVVSRRSRAQSSDAVRAGGAIEVAAGLVFRGGRLLIAQRLLGGRLGGLWEFPGGKREPGEPWAVCLRRELREELRIEVNVGAMIEEITHAYPGRTVRLRFFRCRWWRGAPQAVGCRAFAWVTPPELGDYRFPPADARLLARLQRERTLWAAPRRPPAPAPPGPVANQAR